jgi:hypothetical protein
MLVVLNTEHVNMHVKATSHSEQMSVNTNAYTKLITLSSKVHSVYQNS